MELQTTFCPASTIQTWLLGDSSVEFRPCFV